MPVERGEVPSGLLRLAAEAAAPGLTRSASNRRFGPRSGWLPRSGQVWRGVRDDVSLLVLLLEVRPDSVTIVPVTIELPADPRTHVVLRTTALGVPATAWTTLVRSLPTSVLDRPVDEVDVAVVAAIRRTGVEGDEVPVASDDERVAELIDELAWLAEVTDPREATVGTESGGATIDVAALTGDELSDAAHRIGVSLPGLLELLDGERPPTPEQAEVMRDVFGAVPDLHAPPAELIDELSQPRWRTLVRSRRRPGGTTEATARTALAYDVHAMAARQTGDQAPSWPDRIRRWAQIHQLDPDAEA